MTYIPNAGGVVPRFILAADVANAGTFTCAYPSGFVQASFTAGLAVPNGSYIMVNGNDKVLEDLSGATGVGFSFGSTTVTITNNTGATLSAGATIDVFLNQVDGNAADTFAFPVDLVDVSAADVVSGIRLGVDGTIENVEWIQRTPATTAAKAATLSLKIGSTAVTGGAVALTSANCTPLGARVAGTQVTAANRITKKDALTVVAASVTAFVEGKGTLYVRVRRDTL